MQRYLSPLERRVADTSKLNFLQGDLGHTDLQEDLEFHSSSNTPCFIRIHPRYVNLNSSFSSCFPHASLSDPSPPPLLNLKPHTDPPLND